VNGTGTNPIASGFAGASSFLHTPFTSDMDPEHLFLLTGLVIICVIAWTRILSLVSRIGSEI
jgi:hypothetical protein